MAEEANQTGGLFNMAAKAFKNTSRALLEKLGGKESADLTKQSLEAFAHGHLKEGIHLRHEAKLEAGKYQSGKLSALGDEIKHLVSGGENVTEHSGPRPTAAKPTPAKAVPQK